MNDATEHPNPKVPRSAPAYVRALAAAALAVAVVGALALGYRYAGDQSAAPPASVEKLSIALPTAPHGALLYIAAAQGYFVAEGLEVTIVPQSHGRAAMDLVVQGKTELAAAAEVVAVLAIMKGEALGIAANMLNASNDPRVVARRNRGIAAPGDLAGKKIGVTFGTSGEYFMWAFLIRHKLAPDSVTLVDLPPGPLVQALASGAIDAIATWHPHSLNARAALGDNAVFLDGAGAYTQTMVLVGRSDFLKGHPAAIAKLVRALLKAEQFMQSRPEEALKLVAARLELEVENLRPVWKDFSFRVELLQSQLITLEDEARWAMARGHVANGPVPNFLPHLYLDALLAVRPERVTVVR